MEEIAVAAIAAFGTVLAFRRSCSCRFQTVHRVVNSNHAAALQRIADLEVALAVAQAAEIKGLQDALLKSEESHTPHA